MSRIWPIALAGVVIPLPLPGDCLRQQAPPRTQNPSPMVDTTRPHPRIPQQEVEGRRFSLSRGTLYLSPRFRPRAKVPLLAHFHGAPWLMEDHVMHRVPSVALVAVNLGIGSGIYAQTFAEPSAFERLVTEARERLRQATGQQIEWSSITLTAFSAGYGAIRAILQQPDDYQRVNAIFLADGLHTSYVPEGTPGRIAESSLTVFVRFAEDAARRRKHFWMTHSEVYPGTFASTTETADYILTRLGLIRKPVLRWGPLGMQQLSYAKRGNFHLAGFAGNSAPDHLDHLYALGEWLQKMKHLRR